MSETSHQPDILPRHILSLADTKRILGLRYSDWLLGAPSIETGIAASAMAQDEWGHARLLYSMLKDFGFDPFEIEHERPAERYYSAPALDEPMDDWPGLVCASVIVDGALSCALRSFAAGNFELAVSRIPKMLAEEAFHHDFGSAWYKRLAAAGGEARAAVEASTNAMLPSTLAWLCPDDAEYNAMHADGKVLSTAELRNDFNDHVGPTLAAIGIDVASVTGSHDDFDPIRRRGSGAPRDEAVERARGDQNRALFVE